MDHGWELGSGYLLRMYLSSKLPLLKVIKLFHLLNLQSTCNSYPFILTALVKLFCYLRIYTISQLLPSTHHKLEARYSYI